MKVYENALIEVEVVEGECYVTNKLSGHIARLDGGVDGFYTWTLLAGEDEFELKMKRPYAK